LIGKVGSDGQPFQVGSSLKNFPAPSSGELFLGVNDNPSDYFDNTGEWIAFVQLHCEPPPVAEVDVALPPQQTSQWCWAASGEMVMKTVKPGTIVTQCDEANKRFGLTNCCYSPFPACVRGGWPQFKKYGFNNLLKHGPLTFEEITQEISPSCGNRPFAFSWHWLGSGGHMMVAVGYLHNFVDNSNYVIYDDPWPPNVGTDEVFITYDYFVAGANHTHWDDYYDVETVK
jgi:hypothetical protein